MTILANIEIKGKLSLGPWAITSDRVHVIISPKEAGKQWAIPLDQSFIQASPDGVATDFQYTGTLSDKNKVLIPAIPN